MSKKPRWLTPAITLFATGITAFVLFGIRDHFKTDELQSALKTLSFWNLIWAALATILSFVMLALMEYLGAASVSESLKQSQPTGQPTYEPPTQVAINKISFKKASLYSFIIYGISNTFGVAGLASTPLRLRLYGAEKISTAGVLSLCLIASSAFWIGLAFVIGVSLIATALFEPNSLHFPQIYIGLTGIAFLAGALASCWFLAGRGTSAIGNMRLAFPGKKQMVIQSALAASDWFLAGLALYVLIPRETGSTFFAFFSGFFLSQVAALVSSVPGGIGIIESFNLYMMHPPENTIHQLAAAFIAYRGVYYLPPLIISLILFAVWNFKREKNTFVYAMSAMGQYVKTSIPLLTASGTGIIGLALLLNSGHVFTLLMEWSPLSAFSESVIGTGLLILAVGLYERSSSVRVIAMTIMFPIPICSIIYNSSIYTFIISATTFFLLLLNKKEFYRKSEISAIKNQQRFSLLVLLPVLTTMALAVFMFYQHELAIQQWWKVAFDGNSSSALRGSVGSLVTLGAYGLWALLTPRGRQIAERATIKNSTSLESSDNQAIAKSTYTTSWLALVGDKTLFRFQGIDGFIMYKVARPFWIAMGEPICPTHQRRELMTEFLGDCDRHGGIPVFYQTRPETLSQYVEIGFQAVKIGEEARVLLSEFSLEGRDRKSMRNTCNRVERDGYKFAILSREVVVSRLEELRGISDQWLGNLSMREKAFSIGFFNDSYIASSDVGVILKENQIVAFANLWLGGEKEEFSVDLMRYGTDAPSGIMEYLIIQLLLHAKSESYKWFNLGMAPLAGLEGIRNGRQWHRVGTVIYRAGEAFYNFRGLKSFKDKFGPTWESRFLVYPPGSSLARVLSSAALLINRGVKNHILPQDSNGDLPAKISEEKRAS